jgi:hypothetical protein
MVTRASAMSRRRRGRCAIPSRLQKVMSDPKVASVVEELMAEPTSDDKLPETTSFTRTDTKKPAAPRSGKKIRELTWPTSVDASVMSFFGKAFDCDTTFPGEAVWSRDDEAVTFLAAPATDSVEFHNRVLAGEVALFPLGQRFTMFYKGERRDHFAAEFGYLGTLVVAWGSAS